MIHGGGGAKWTAREYNGYMEINVYVWFIFVDEHVNNTLHCTV